MSTKKPIKQFPLLPHDPLRKYPGILWAHCLSQADMLSLIFSQNGWKHFHWGRLHQTLANILVNEVVSRYGVPESIHSDQGGNFCSAVSVTYWESVGHKHQDIIPRAMVRQNGLTVLLSQFWRRRYKKIKTTGTIGTLHIQISCPWIHWVHTFYIKVWTYAYTTNRHYVGNTTATDKNLQPSRFF